MDTNLVAIHTRHTSDANRIFGTRNGENVPMVIYPGKPLRPYIIVPEGMYALVQNSGSDQNHPSGTVCWPAGYHATGFFSKVSHLITKQNIVFDTPVKGCPTADNVLVHIDTCIVIRVMGHKEGEDESLVRKFVYELGPVSLTQQLKDAQEEAVRTLARSKMYTEVYNLSGETCDSMQRDFNEQFNPFGIEIVDVAITNVRLGAQIQNEMEMKTLAKSEQEEQIMSQKFLTTQMNLKEEYQLLIQEAADARLAEVEKFERLNAEIIGERDEIVSETKKAIALIAEAKKAEVKMIYEKGDAEKLALLVEKDAILKEKDALAKARAEEIRAETKAWVTKAKAVGHANVAKFEADAFKELAEAEGKVAPMIRERREFELECAKTSVIQNLSRNDKVAISGMTDNSLLAEILTNNNQSNVLLGLGHGKNGSVDFMPPPPKY